MRIIFQDIQCPGEIWAGYLSSIRSFRYWHMWTCKHDWHALGDRLKGSSFYQFVDIKGAIIEIVWPQNILNKLHFTCT
jgi:hypothetical protein